MAQELSGRVSTLALTSDMARHAAKRHALIAQNVANADTPGFKARDIGSFSDVLKTHATRADGTDRIFERSDIESPNGNSVSLEDELMRGTQVQNDYNMAISIYRSTLQMMKTAVGKNL